MLRWSTVWHGGSTRRCARRRHGSCVPADVTTNRAPSGPASTMLRSQSGFGVVEHLGPCVAVDGLDVGWVHPTTPLGEGTLTW